MHINIPPAPVQTYLLFTPAPVIFTQYVIGTPGGTLVGGDQLRVRFVPEGNSIKLVGLFGKPGDEKENWFE